MYQPGALIIYGSSGVCRVTAVEPGREDPRRLCYTLSPLYGTETIYVPVDAKVFTRPVLTRREAERLVRELPAIAVEDLPEPGGVQALSRHYQEAFDAHDCRALVRLLKAIHHKNALARKSGKRPGKLEERYQKRAEDLLYGELAAALEIPREEVPLYIKRALREGSSAEIA